MTEKDSEQDYLLRRRVEDLAQGYLSLASELWIVKDRLMLLEHLLERHGVPSAEIDTLEPAGDFKEQLDQARRAWTHRTVAALFPKGLPKTG